MNDDPLDSRLRREARGAGRPVPEGLERGILAALERPRGAVETRRPHPFWLLLLTAGTTALATIAMSQRTHATKASAAALVSHGPSASPALTSADPLERESAALEGQARVAAAYLADAFTPGEHPRT